MQILPVTAENLQKLEDSTDINLSLPITSTYLRRMRQRTETSEARDCDEVRCRHYSLTQG